MFPLGMRDRYLDPLESKQTWSPGSSFKGSSILARAPGREQSPTRATEQAWRAGGEAGRPHLPLLCLPNQVASASQVGVCCVCLSSPQTHVACIPGTNK